MGTRGVEVGIVRVAAAAGVAFLMIASVAGFGGPVGPASANQLWGVIGNHLVTIDAATGRVTRDVGTTPAYANLEGITYDPRAGVMYGIADGAPAPKLVRIDLQSGSASLIGAIDSGRPDVDLKIAEALAFDEATGLLYAAVGEVPFPTASDRLAVVDPATGTARVVAPFSGLQDADAMAFADGVLYATDTQPPRTFLYTVNPATAESVLVGEVGFNHVADLAYDASTRTLYGTAHTSRLLIRISTTTGQGTSVGTTHTAQDFGGATLTAIAFGPAPLASPCVLSVTQGATSYTVRPVERATSLTSFYNYYSASAHTPYVEAYASVLFLYRETTTGRMYLVFHFNIDEGGSPDAATTVGLTGIPAGATAALSDDPGEFQMTRYPQGQFQYWLNTDGGALGPLPTDAEWALRSDVAHGGPSPMKTQKWVDGDGTRLALAMTGTITIRSACNDPPVPHAGGPYTGVEGSPITFDASGSTDPDGDPLTYAWDFEDDGVVDLTTTNPKVTWGYPDDFQGRARLFVSDGTETADTTADVTVANVPPTIMLLGVGPPTPEGDLGPWIEFLVTDPGADRVDLWVDFAWGIGYILVKSWFHPQNEYLGVAGSYYDDGAFGVSLLVRDDDGGEGLLAVTAVVDNVAPTIVSLFLPSEADEGSEVTAVVTAVDPGSDDLSFRIDFGNGDVQSETFYNDGVGPDPDLSPLGTYPFRAEASFTTRYDDDGDVTVRVLVEDDDGGAVTLEAPLRIRNVAPTIVPFGPAQAVEGFPSAITATATDPGSDDLTFLWEFELGPTITETFPATGSPASATSTAPFVYGDDGSYRVRLTVTDGDGGVAVYETTVVVANAPPTASIVQVSRPAAFTLRVAGEKWHDVTAMFFQDGRELASLRVVRTPGSPNDQAASTDVFDLALGSAFTARVVYTPEDDPVNGQPWGASPAWILVGPPGEEILRIHHTFNVRHAGTYVWDVDLTPELARLGVVFEGYADDPGSDDLTFAWDFGDGGVAVTTYFNDGVGPDGPRSPGGTFPFASADIVRHAFAGPGTYVVTLTVTDDDGGVSVATVTITIAG